MRSATFAGLNLAEETTTGGQNVDRVCFFAIASAKERSTQLLRHLHKKLVPTNAVVYLMDAVSFT